ncbi:MAG TPA: lytic transglycosylase [Flavobacteriales bacterium]|nr:lytic transglycosylase [Flavobacteriales bacterium]
MVLTAVLVSGLLGAQTADSTSTNVELSVVESSWLEWCQATACASNDTALWNIRDFVKGETPLLDTATIQMRMHVLDAASPMDLSWNPIAHSRIAFYAANRPIHLGRMLGRVPLYFPLFEEALDRHDLPLELKYLAVVESGLNPKARSHAGARGLWQFMYATARGQGLRIDSYIDERRDPVRSSEAACVFLKKLYNQYGDWYLALAAYNAGPGNVNKAIRRSGGKKNFWEIRYFLPRETRNYVPAFMAVLYLMEYHAEHNIFPAELFTPYAALDTVEVNTVLRFDQIAAHLNMDVESLSQLNPMFRLDIIPGPPEKWPLVLPQNLIPSFLAYQKDMILHEPERTPKIVFVPEPVIYRVKSGDVLGGIASSYGVSVKQLKEWNGLKGTMIRVGQKLKIHANPRSL